MAIESWEVTAPGGSTGAVLVDTVHEEPFGPVFDSPDHAEAFLRFAHSKGRHIKYLTRSEIRSLVRLFSKLELTRCESCDELRWEENPCPC